MNGRTAFGWAILLSGAAAWIFAPILSLTLLSDDFGLLGMLRQRLAEEGGLTLDLLFAERWHETFANYRPLLAVSIATDEAFFGSNALGFHLTQLMLHVVAAFTLALLAAAFVADRPGAHPARARWAGLLAGSIFLVHPFHSETLAWIAARGDLLATLAVLLGLLCFERFRSMTRGRRWQHHWLLASWLCFAAALLSKESALLAPLLPAGLDLWRRRDAWRRVGRLRYALPHLLLIALIPLYLAVRAQVMGGLIGKYGGASPFDPARLSEFRQFLPQTLLSLILPINAETPRGFIPFARWAVLILGLVLLGTGLPLRKRRLLGATAWAAAWWLVTIGVFFPLFASGKGVTHYRLFYGPTAAGALLAGSWWAAATAAGGWRRIAASVALVGMIVIYGVTGRLDLRAYTRASQIVRTVAADLEEIRSEVEHPDATFVVFDTPTIVRSAPVFGAYLPMAFGRWLRPDDPIALVPWLGGEPLPFLMATAGAHRRSGYVLRWRMEERTLERVSAFLPGTLERSTDTMVPEPVIDVTGTVRWTGLTVQTARAAAIAITFEDERSRSGTLRLRTSEDDRFNPMPSTPFATTAQELVVVPAPPGEWLLAGELEGVELELVDAEPGEGVSLRLLGRAPEIELEELASGRIRVIERDPAREHRLMIVLRRRHEVRSLAPDETSDGVLRLPDRSSFRPAVDTVPEVPVVWYLERLAPDGRVVARSRPRSLDRSPR